ncbi:MAG: hypothetical protein J6X93_00785 [Bacilli bacterium]|nr:hypothetical protein [Bacilli bacterium]
MLALTTTFIISNVIMSSAKNEIKTSLDLINASQVRDGSVDNRMINEVNKRMTMELYDDAGNLAVNIGVFGIEREEAPKKDEFELIVASYYVDGDVPSDLDRGDVYLLAYNTDVDWIYIVRAPGSAPTQIHITNVIFYMDVNSELQIRARVVRIYVVSVIAILVLALVVSFWASRFVIKAIMEAFEKQTNFVSDASHELRTPLAIIQSKLENVLSHSDKTVMDVSDDLAVSLNEVIRLSKLTNNLLTLSRSDREKIDLDLQETDVYNLVLQTAEPFVEIGAMSGKTIDFDCEHIVASIDKDKINQILVILLDNALRYTDEGDKITVRLSKVKDELSLSVIDTGIGISEETKAHMFDRFYREDKARNRDTGGRGLGLAIAKALVNICNGKISADHNNPKGTIMSIIIPVNKK